MLRDLSHGEGFPDAARTERPLFRMGLLLEREAGGAIAA